MFDNSGIFVTENANVVEYIECMLNLLNQNYLMIRYSSDIASLSLLHYKKASHVVI